MKVTTPRYDLIMSFKSHGHFVPDQEFVSCSFVQLFNVPCQNHVYKRSQGPKPCSP